MTSQYASMSVAAALAGIGKHILALLILNPDAKALTIKRVTSLIPIAVIAVMTAALASMVHQGMEGFIARLFGIAFVGAICFALGDWRTILPGVLLISVGMDLVSSLVAGGVFISGIEGADAAMTQLGRLLGIWQFVCLMSLFFKAKASGG